MATRDVVQDQSSGRVVMKRSEAIEPWANVAAWDAVSDRFEVAIQDIVDSDEGGTDLATALLTVRKNFPQLRGVVLMADGDWNVGQSPVQAATQFRMDGVPIYGLAVGSSTRLPDIEIVNFDLPTFGVVGKPIRIPITLESSLPRDVSATVVLSASDGTEVRQDLRIAAMSRTSEALIWNPNSIGDFTVKLEVPLQSDETIEDNNALSAPIAIREEKLKVLVIESIPRWEYRYLRNALSRDPGVDVHCLLFHEGLSKPGSGNKDYISAFPDGLDQLAQYDVVFLGDVGVDGGHLTREQCRLLKGLVEQQASGLVFLPGWQGKQNSLFDTELADLFPVLLEDGQATGWGSRTPSQFELTESGRRSLLTKLADTSDDNMQVWGSLPGFQWYAPVLRAKPGAEVLAVHRDASNAYGRIPLLVTRTFGTGKVLFMGTDGAWRWRRGVEDLYHYRFWGQVVRWMAYQRNMAKGSSMRLFYTPEQPQVRQTVTLNANIMSSSGEPLSDAKPVVRIVAPSGKAETVRLSSEKGEWGAFQGTWLTKEPGTHRATLQCDEVQSELEATLFVQGGAIEKVGKPARPEVLQELSRISHGEVLSLDKISQGFELLLRIPDPPISVRRLQLWSHPMIVGILIGLLGLFWIGRKWVGLV